MMTQEEIDEAIKICNTATAGPWKTDIGGQSPWCVYEFSTGKIIANLIPKNTTFGMTSCCNNAAFIAFARTALPKALAALAEAKTKLAAIMAWTKKEHENMAYISIVHGVNAVLDWSEKNQIESNEIIGAVKEQTAMALDTERRAGAGSDG